MMRTALVSGTVAGAPFSAARTFTVDPRMGASASSQSTFDSFNASASPGVGPMTARRTYQSGAPALPASFASSVAATDVAAGRVSIWSFKPNMLTFATDTAAQNALRAFLASYPTTGAGLIAVIYHEPEDNIAAGSFTLAQYKTVTNIVGDIIASLGRTNIKLATCLMGPWTVDTRSTYSSSNWWDPGFASRVSYVGIDPYKWNPSDGSLQQILTINNSGTGGGGAAPSILQWIRDTTGKSWIPMEWGCTETGVSQTVKAQWITDAFAFLRAQPDCPIATYFNINPGTDGAGRDTWLLHDAPLAAYRAACIDSRT